MTGAVVHIGITVKDMDRSLAFYRDLLGLEFQGELLMEGKETDLLFQKENVRARVCYLNGSKELFAPSIELISFLSHEIRQEPSDLFKTSVSEICFQVPDMEKFYLHLTENGVECLSDIQTFDFTKYSFKKSKAIYFKDPDGIILEAMEYID